MPQEALFIVISSALSYLTVVVHFSAEVLFLRVRILLAVTASIEHVTTDFVVVLETFAVAVELRVFELRIAQLGQDLLAEAAPRLSDAGRDAPAMIESVHSAYSGVVGAEMLFIFANDLIDLTMASRIADLLREFVHLG